MGVPGAENLLWRLGLVLFEKREGWELDGQGEQGEKTGGASGHQSMKDQQVMGGAWVLSQENMDLLRGKCTKDHYS